MKRDYVLVAIFSLVAIGALVFRITLAMSGCDKNTVNQRLTPCNRVEDRRTPETCGVPEHHHKHKR
jgi:hypothetical protein